MKIMGEGKTVGITCDNYKLDKFKKELTEKGFTDFTVSPFKKDISLIKINCLDSDYPVIASICQEVENHFGAMKN